MVFRHVLMGMHAGIVFRSVLPRTDLPDKLIIMRSEPGFYGWKIITIWHILGLTKKPATPKINLDFWK